MLVPAAGGEVVSPPLGLALHVLPSATTYGNVLVNVTCPQGVVAGQVIQIQTPAGQTAQVIVPAGVGAGMQFQASVPGAVPEVNGGAYANPDLKAYDDFLAGASRLTFHAIEPPKSSNTFKMLRIDAEGVFSGQAHGPSNPLRGGVSILLHFGKKGEGKPGKNVKNEEPWGAFTADIVLGDGSVPGHIVQTVSSAGLSGMNYYDRPNGPPVMSMDRSDKLEFYQKPSSCTDALSPFTKCQATEHTMTVNRPDGGLRLVATVALNKASCRRAWCDALCGIATFCSGPVFLLCCVASATVHYEMQSLTSAGTPTPVGGALYTQPGQLCCENCGGNAGLPDKGVVDLGAAPVQARRDVVAAIAYSARAFAAPDTA